MACRCPQVMWQQAERLKRHMVSNPCMFLDITLLRRPQYFTTVNQIHSGPGNWVDFCKTLKEDCFPFVLCMSKRRTNVKWHYICQKKGTNVRRELTYSLLSAKTIFSELHMTIFKMGSKKKEAIQCTSCNRSLQTSYKLVY